MSLTEIKLKLLTHLKGSAPRVQRITIGFLLGAVVGGVCYHAGLSPFAVSAIAVGVAANVVLGL